MVEQKGIGIIDGDIVAVFSNNTELLQRFILSQNTVCKGYMNKLRRELKMHHFNGQVLSGSIMDSDAAILTAADQEFSSVIIFDRFERLVELGERVDHLGCVNVEYSHSSCVEATSEDWECGMTRNAEWLLIGRRELIELVKCFNVPKSDSFIFADSDQIHLHKMEIKSDYFISV